jgi:spore coat-associated protein N
VNRATVRVRSVTSRLNATPRRMLITLGGLVAASAVAVGSGANFNASSANPGTIISVGTIVVTDSLAGLSILTVNPLKPGGSVSGTVTIRNGGTAPAGFTVAPANLVNTPASPALSSKLTLVVQDLEDPTCTVSCPAAVTIYSGTLGSMGTLTLGTFAASVQHQYKFSVTFPDGGPNGADNAYGGAITTLDYLWTATQ